MTANNWTICPRCQKTEQNRLATKRQTVADAYGKVTAEEYERLKLVAEASPWEEVTLREDYELGIWLGDDGDAVFEVGYSASCLVCGFEHRFTHKDALNVKAMSL